VKRRHPAKRRASNELHVYEGAATKAGKSPESPGGIVGASVTSKGKNTNLQTGKIGDKTTNLLMGRRPQSVTENREKEKKRRLAKVIPLGVVSLRPRRKRKPKDARRDPGLTTRTWAK